MSLKRHNPVPATVILMAALALGTPLPAAETPPYTRQPIHIESDRAEMDQIAGRSVYSGNVTLTQGEAVLRGDEITVTRLPGEDNMRIVVTGDPATYHEPRTAPAPPVDARSARMQYDTDSEILQLSGNARVARGSDVLRGDDIRYHRREERILASGGAEESGRVQIIIQPRDNGNQQ